MAARPLFLDPNLNIIFGITLMSVLGVASIAPAFPGITSALGVPDSNAAWLISMFTIPGLLFTPVAGILSDRYGRRKILVPCLLLFGAAGGGCFFAPDFRTLLFLRFLQGVGSAPLNSLNVTIIADLFIGKERSTAIGYNAGVIGAGTASYPALGGLLAMLGWNYPFLLAFAAVPIAIWALMNLDETREPFKEKTPGPLWSPAPIFPSLIAKKTPALLVTSMMTFIIQYGGFLTFLPFYLAGVHSATPLTIGLVSASMSISSALTSIATGKFLHRLSSRILLPAAFSLYSSALIFILHVPGCPGMVVPAVLFGIGQGINIPTLMTKLTNNSPEDGRALFLSINSMFLRLGQTLGPLLFGFIFASMGIKAVFTSGAAMAAIMAVILVWALKPVKGEQ